MERRRLPVKPLGISAMRLPRVRFTVRRMMVTVAAVALLPASWKDYHQRRAACPHGPSIRSGEPFFSNGSGVTPDRHLVRHTGSGP